MLEHTAGSVSQQHMVEEAQATLVEAIRQTFERRIAPGPERDRQLADLMGLELDADAFWRLALEALATGRLQIGFAPTGVSSELQPVASFLNDQLVAISGRPVSPLLRGSLDPLAVLERRWDEQAFFEALRARRDEGEVALADAVLTWARDRGLLILWEGGATEGTFTPTLSPHGERHDTAVITTGGLVQLPMARRAETRLFSDPGLLQTLTGLLDGLPRDREGEAVVLSLAQLGDPQMFGQVIGALDWIVDTVLLTNQS
jgi:hypothetical protein